MTDLPKILLSGLPPALVHALGEQWPPTRAVLAREDDGTAFDLAICGADIAGPEGAAILRVDPARGPVRLGALLRLIDQALAEPALHAEDIALDGWTFSPRDRQITRSDNGTAVSLTDRETELLTYLARRRGAAAGRDDLLKDVWQYQPDVDTHTIETHIYRLRQKIGMGDNGPLVNGADGGYLLRLAAAARGSIYGYILIAIFLIGLLTVTLSSGPHRSALTTQIEEATSLVHADLARLSAAVEGCVTLRPTPTDVNGDGVINATDNPNPPFPVYVTAGVSGATGGTGINIDFRTNNIACPGTPGMPAILTAQQGAGMRALGNASVYAVNYLSDATEGVLVRVTRATASEVWTETLSRLNGRYSACKAAAVTAAGTCVNGCFYLWMSRRPTSVIATTDDGVTCP